MKRAQRSSSPLPRGKVQRAVNANSEAGPLRSNQQPSGRRQATNTELVAAGIGTPSQFDPQVWFQGAVPDDLAALIKREWIKARKPSSDGCWTFIGNPMPKDAVCAHWGAHKGFFQKEISSHAELQKELFAPAPCDRKTEAVITSELVALFHFEGLAMTDKDTGEAFQVFLGTYVIIKEEVPNGTKNGGGTDTTEYVGRITEIFVTMQGKRYIRIHWMYRDKDTPIAAAPHKDKRAAEGEERTLPRGEFMTNPRRVWLCGSEEDNESYSDCYTIEQIDRPCKVYHIPPGIAHPSQVDVLKDIFDPDNDWFYNQWTVAKFMTIEDCYEDWTPWSQRYKEVWLNEGVEGILALKRQHPNCTQLMRGRNRERRAAIKEKQVLLVMELFAGGGGLSYICQRNDNVIIHSGWANDFNNSAAATYTCNHPDTKVSCIGLEEYTQLIIKWGQDFDRFFPQNWQSNPRIATLRKLHAVPQHLYSRQHTPRGIGCYGNTVNSEGSSADASVAAAQRAQDALVAAAEKGDIVPEAQSSTPEPNWEEVLVSLPDVSQSIGQHVAELLDNDYGKQASGNDSDDDTHRQGTKHKQKETARRKSSNSKGAKDKDQAYSEATAIQAARIQECKAYNDKHKLGKVLEVRDVRITDCAVRVKHGSSKDQVVEGLTEWECWLEYDVLRESTGASSSSTFTWTWEHQSLLYQHDAVEPVRKFMLRMLADKTIPMPGDVQVLIGGPPCQNVSGLNRHAKQQDVLQDPKNRLVTSYMKLIEYLKPDFILMEQVTDVFKKEEAIYARYALMQMVQMGFQARAGICAAGHYGPPQGRLRALFWGARSGRAQLPPFPAATHLVKDFNTCYPTSANQCKVLFASPAGKANALPIAVMGDVLTDLPPLDNFDEADRSGYANPPKCVLQVFLRRPPPSYSRPLLERCIHADAAMAPWCTLNKNAESIVEDGSMHKVVAVGQKILCRNKGGMAKGTTATKAGIGNKYKNTKQGSKKAAATGAADADGATEEADADAVSADAEGESEAAAALAAAAEGNDDEEADSAEELAELDKQMQESKNFARETWQAYLKGKDKTEREALEAIKELEGLNNTWLLGERRLRLLAAANKVDLTAPLRDHRCLTCNADDFGRMAAVVKEKGGSFRDMPGVITHSDGRCCSGSWHAAQYPKKGQKPWIDANVRTWKEMSDEDKEGKDPFDILYKDIQLEGSCAGGGVPPKPPKGWKGKDGNDKSLRVDNYGSAANGGFRGVCLEKCCSEAYWLPTGDLVCPRWCVTYKDGKSMGRHGCFGRVWYDDIQPTVVTRAEPHNLQLIHPEQDRVLSIRENARCQGFPDHHVFVGLGGGKGRNSSHGKGSAVTDERYMQVGNAVAPPLAAALGRCLLLAVEQAAPVAVPVVEVPDPDYQAAVKAAEEMGLGHWSEKIIVDESKGNDYYRVRYGLPPLCKNSAPASTGAAGGAAAAGASGTQSRRQPAKKQRMAQQAAAAVGAADDANALVQDMDTANAAAVDAGVVAAAIPRKMRRNVAGHGGPQRTEANSNAVGKTATAGDKTTASAAGSGASKRKKSAAAANPSKRSRRSAATAATAAAEAIKDSLVQEATRMDRLAKELQQRRQWLSNANEQLLAAEAAAENDKPAQLGGLQTEQQVNAQVQPGAQEPDDAAAAERGCHSSAESSEEAAPVAEDSGSEGDKSKSDSGESGSDGSDPDANLEDSSDCGVEDQAAEKATPAEDEEEEKNEEADMQQGTGGSEGDSVMEDAITTGGALAVNTLSANLVTATAGEAGTYGLADNSAYGSAGEEVSSAVKKQRHAVSAGVEQQQDQQGSLVRAVAA